MNLLSSDNDTQINVGHAQQLADLLEATVKDVAPAWFTIQLPNDQGKLWIHTSCPAKKDKWLAFGEFPQSSQGVMEPAAQVKINISKSRGIQALADAIKKRLLPVYILQYAEYKALAEEANQATKQQEDVTSELCKLLGKKCSDYTRQSGNIRIHSFYLDTVRVEEANKIVITTQELPLDVAKEVILLLQSKLKNHHENG